MLFIKQWWRRTNRQTYRQKRRLVDRSILPLELTTFETLVRRSNHLSYPSCPKSPPLVTFSGCVGLRTSLSEQVTLWTKGLWQTDRLTGRLSRWSKITTYLLCIDRFRAVKKIKENSLIEVDFVSRFREIKLISLSSCTPTGRSDLRTSLCVVSRTIWAHLRWKQTAGNQIRCHRTRCLIIVCTIFTVCLQNDPECTFRIWIKL